MGSIKQFAGQTIIYGFGSVLSKLVYYLLVVVLLTYLLEGKTYEFGTYGELYAYVAVLIILFSLKLDTALFRFGNKKEKFNEAYDTCFTMILASAFLLLSFGLFFTKELAALIQYSSRPEYIQCFVFILAFDTIALVPFAKLRLENKAKVFAMLKIFNVAFSSVLILFFLIIYPRWSSHSFLSWVPKFPAQIDYIFFTNLISSALLLLLVLIFAKARKLKPSLNVFKKIIPYVIPLIIVGMCNTFIQTNGAVVIKYFSVGENLLDNLSQAGVFDSSRRIAGLFVLFIGAFNYAAEPFFFNNSTETDRKKLYGKICHLFVLISGVIILGLVLSQDLVQYIVGKDFRESIFIIPILLSAYLFLGIYHNISIWYKLSDKTKWGAFISIIGAVITIIFSYILIPQWGYVAFAWANLSSYIVMVLLAYFIGQRLYPIYYPIKDIVFSVFVIALILFVSYLLQGYITGFQKYLYFTVLYIVYLLYAFKVEKHEWLSLLPKNKS